MGVLGRLLARLRRLDFFLKAAVEAALTWERIACHWQQVALARQREIEDVLTAWRLSLEHPDVDMRDEIDAALRRASDETARMEEYVV